MPIIEGGTYRVWPRTKDLQLSAEQSYDPNMDPDNQSLLHYRWECQGTSKVSSGLGKWEAVKLRSGPLPTVALRKKSAETLSSGRDFVHITAVYPESPH